MHTHPFSIERVAKELGGEILNTKLLNAFTTSLNEVFLEFETIVLKIYFFNGVAFFQLPDAATLQKKNRLVVLKSTLGTRVKGVDVFPFDRQFSIVFENENKLHFFLFGRFGQVALYEKGILNWHFPAKSKEIAELPLEKLNEEMYLNAHSEAENTGKIPLYNKLMYETFSSEKNEQLLARETPDFLAKLRQWSVAEASISVVKKEEIYTVKFGKHDQAIFVSQSILDAFDQFSKLHIAQQTLVLEKRKREQALQKKLKQALARQKSLQQSIQNLQTQDAYKEKADLLMANLWQLKIGEETVKLLSFDGNTTVEVQLKKDLSPQNNAQRYYAKSKNAKTQQVFAQKNLDECDALIQQLRQELTNIESINEIRQIRKIPESKSPQQLERLPYHVFQYRNYEMKIGKSATDNDTLIRNFANKNDIWLHAKDVSGSHVIVKNQSNKPLPVDVLETAAQIAAYYSKAKTEGLVSVIYTERKYVRKPKGAAPGKVIVEKEQSILVEPINHLRTRLNER